MNNKIITRFAPSPTGALHVGGARTALFNYFFAKKYGGEMVLRIEDTDKDRSKKEYEDDIINGLKWLNIKYTKSYRQSDRGEVYKKYLEKMIKEGKAYVSKETEGKSKEVIRFKNPNTKIKFKDLIRGEIEFDTTELGDFVVAKNLETPLYHLAVVVDDFEMGITHIIRGDDGISNTPRQILIQEAIGASRPEYAHIPLILAPDRSKLSKRHNALSLLEYEKGGYLPEAMINFLALLGWSPQGKSGRSDRTDEEIFSLDELIEKFDIKNVQKSGAVFNINKLDWINGQYIKNMDIERLVELCKPYFQISIFKFQFSNLEKIVELQQGRMQKLSDVANDIDYFFKEPDYKAEMLMWRPASPSQGGKEKNLINTKNYLEELIKMLSSLKTENFNKESIKETIWGYAEEKGRGNVLWPMRFALTGQEKSPDPFSVAGVLGKEEAIKRLQNAINKI